MNRQEIFNKVAEHLIKQGARATQGKDVVGNPKCAYRTEDGKKCAVGCLISDEAYIPELEGKSCEAMVILAALARSGISVSYDDSWFLRELQMVHDFERPSDWRAKLRAFASRKNLELPACLQ